MTTQRDRPDAIGAPLEALSAADLAIADAVLSSIAEEMGEALGRTAYSPNIKERRDFSCAVFDPEGAMVAQAAHMPVHLGSMPASVLAVMGGSGRSSPATCARSTTRSSAARTCPTSRRSRPCSASRAR